jgi:hypothetical protein
MSEAGAPIIYEENRIKVLNALKDGRIDYLDLADWTFQDRFFAFLLGLRFFEICLCHTGKKRIGFGRSDAVEV